MIVLNFDFMSKFPLLKSFLSRLDLILTLDLSNFGGEAPIVAKGLPKSILCLFLLLHNILIVPGLFF